MVKIKFEDGTIVNFQGTPTPKDIDEVAKSLALKKNNLSPVNNLNTPPEEKPGGAVLNTASDFVGTTKLGQGLSTVGSKVPEQVGNINAQDLQSVSKLIQAIHNQTDPAKKQHLINSLKTIYGVNFEAPTAEKINPGFGLSNKEVLGSAAQTVLSVVAAGSLPTKGASSFALSKGLPVAETVAKSTGLTGKALSAAKIGAKSLEGGLLGYGFDVSQKAINNQENITTPGAGTAIGIALPPVSKFIGSTLKRTLGFTTNVGSKVIDRAVQNPSEVNNAVRQYAGDNASKIGLIAEVKSAVQAYLKQRGEEFGQAVSQTTFSKSFPKQEIIDEFSSQLKPFKGLITKEGLTFNSSKLTSADEIALQGFWNKLQTWKDFTPTGIEDLRQAVGNYMKQYKITGNAQANVILGGLKKFITSGLEERASGYKQILNTYGAKSQLATDLLSELSMKTEGGKTSTKLSNILKIFKKDPQIIQGFEQIMGKDKTDQLLNKIAGAVLSDNLPQGISGLIKEGGITLGGLYALISGAVSLPAVIAGAASTSPKIVGKAVTITGKAIQKGAGTFLRRFATKAASLVK